MMKQPPLQRPRKDEREMAIEKEARSYALEGMIVATQILTLICVIKHNPAWKAGLALLFIGGAAEFWSLYKQYDEEDYRMAYKKVGIFLALVGAILYGWFAVTA